MKAKRKKLGTALWLEAKYLMSLIHSYRRESLLQGLVSITQSPCPVAHWTVGSRYTSAGTNCWAAAPAWYLKSLSQLFIQWQSNKAKSSRPDTQSQAHWFTLYLIQKPFLNEGQPWHPILRRYCLLSWFTDRFSQLSLFLPTPKPRVRKSDLSLDFATRLPYLSQLGKFWALQMHQLGAVRPWRLFHPTAFIYSNTLWFRKEMHLPKATEK